MTCRLIHVNVQAGTIDCLYLNTNFLLHYAMQVHLCSSHLLLRRAAVACLRQLAQREAAEVCEYAMSLAKRAGDSKDATISECNFQAVHLRATLTVTTLISSFHFIRLQHHRDRLGGRSVWHAGSGDRQEAVFRYPWHSGPHAFISCRGKAFSLAETLQGCPGSNYR